jgi:hypothetical protein
LGERRLCTAEVRGSNPLGSTLKKWCFQRIRKERQKALEHVRGLLLQPYCNLGYRSVSSRAQAAPPCIFGSTWE